MRDSKNYGEGVYINFHKLAFGFLKVNKLLFKKFSHSPNLFLTQEKVKPESLSVSPFLSLNHASKFNKNLFSV
jgi:hypothetical protein